MRALNERNKAGEQEVFARREAEAEGGGRGKGGISTKNDRKRSEVGWRSLMTWVSIFPSGALSSARSERERRWREAGAEQLLQREVQHVYSCGGTAEVLESASKQAMAPCPAWPSPLAGLPVFGL